MNSHFKTASFVNEVRFFSVLKSYETVQLYVEPIELRFRGIKASWRKNTFWQ